MNFKKIMIVFCISMPVCVTARILQIVLSVEYSNGFYVEEYKTFGNLMLLLIAVVCTVLCICAFKAYKTPENPPKLNAVLSILAAAIAVSLVNELFREVIPQTMPAWQVYVVKLATILCAVYFAVLALQNVLGIQIPPLLHIVPCIYAVAKTIFTFIGISSLALISDNILLMAGYCLLMLFFINYGKLYNNLDIELNFRKILASGLTASTVCLTQSLSYFTVNTFSSEKYLHTDMNTMVTFLFLGIFITAYTVSHFRKTIWALT